MSLFNISLEQVQAPLCTRCWVENRPQISFQLNLSEERNHGQNRVKAWLVFKEFDLDFFLSPTDKELVKMQILQTEHKKHKERHLKENRREKDNGASDERRKCSSCLQTATLCSHATVHLPPPVAPEAPSSPHHRNQGSTGCIQPYKKPSLGCSDLEPLRPEPPSLLSMKISLGLKGCWVTPAPRRDTGSGGFP